MVEIEFATLSRWGEISGMGRSSIYLALSRGDLRAIKNGKRILIHVPSGLEWLRSLPAAEIRIASARKVA